MQNDALLYREGLKGFNGFIPWCHPLPAKTRRELNFSRMLVHPDRLRRWHNIKVALDQRLMFAGLALSTKCCKGLAI